MGRPGVSSHPMYEDPFELEVLRFPGLRAFAVEYDIGLPGNAWQDFSQVDEILPLLAMSPNLKHLAVSLVPSSARAGIDRIKREWGQFTNALKPYPAAHPESLAFDGPDGVNPWEHALLRFGENLGLSYLRSLDIHVYSDPDALRQAALTLNNLEQLSITVDLCGKGFPDLAADNEDMISAIQHFRPLKFLCLRAVRTVNALHCIVSHHGPTLESFVIQPSEKERIVRWKPDPGYKYPVLNDDDILWLAETWPNIQELSIPLKRFGGSPTECVIYKAIGKFKWLHSLILDLHCDCQHGPANTHSTDSTPYLQKMFKNAATDKHLVSAIWKIIISNQIRQRLRNMRCVPFGANLLPQYEKYVINQLSPNFLARGLDSHTLEPLEVVEIGKEGRMCLQEEAGERFREPVQLPQRIRVALDNLWPPLPGRRDQHWLTRWKSFPLHPHERSVG